MIETKWFHHPPSGSQHTAGGFVTDSPDRLSADAQTICHVHHRQEYGRLIAAAPEMLEALLELADWYKEYTGLPPAAANAAIAKATGEEP